MFCVGVYKLYVVGKQVPSIGDGTEVMVPLTLDPDAKPDGTSWSAQVLNNTDTILVLKASYWATTWHLIFIPFCSIF